MKAAFFSRNKEILVYALFMGVALMVLRVLEIRFFLFDMSLELLVGALAVLFTAVGIWVALRFSKPKTVIVEKEVESPAGFALDENRLQRLGISKRELEVLQLLSNGHTNNEIASALFVSPNTVKTHVSKIFEKLEVNRRTQAIQKAKQLQLIA